MKTIGSIIKDRRTSLKLTQQQLADQVGVSISSISLWEKGKNDPSFEKIPVLAEALKCDIAELLGFQEEAPLYTQRLSIEELDILNLFRSLSNDGRNLATEIIYALSRTDALKTKQIPEATEETQSEDLS